MSKNVSNNFLPFTVSLGGVITDLLTTKIGLNMGFSETNVYYNPFVALIIIWSALVLLQLTIRERKILNICIYGVCLYSYLSTVNNILVIFGIFGA